MGTATQIRRSWGVSMAAEIRDWSAVLKEVKAIVEGEEEPGAKAQAVSDLLHSRIPAYDWVGFYVVDSSKQNLVLGPFAGEPTEHVVIAFGQGICGQAAERCATFIVPDVTQESNYLSCSPRVQSEIVVPLVVNGEVVGEIDVDSHTRGAFGEQDRVFLEQVAALLAPLLSVPS